MIGDFFELSPVALLAFRIAMTVFSAFLLLLFFNIKTFERIIIRYKWANRFKKYLHAFEFLTVKELVVIIGLSLLRYLVYVSQFVIILWLLGVSFSLTKMLAAVIITFYSITMVPTIALTEPAVRATVAGEVLGVYSDRADLIMLASVAIWFINLVIPSIAGSVTLLSFKLKNKA